MIVNNWKTFWSFCFNTLIHEVGKEIMKKVGKGRYQGGSNEGGKYGRK